MRHCIRPSRRSNTLLLVALVHYLNACPCGCLEHHALYQTFFPSADAQDAHEQQPGGGPAVTLVASQGDHHCDGCSEVIFTCNRTGGNNCDTCCLAIASQVALVPPVPSLCDPCGESLKLLATSNPALGVCAELQVMLI